MRIPMFPNMPFQFSLFRDQSPFPPSMADLEDIREALLGGERSTLRNILWKALREIQPPCSWPQERTWIFACDQRNGTAWDELWQKQMMEASGSCDSFPPCIQMVLPAGRNIKGCAVQGSERSGGARLHGALGKSPSGNTGESGWTQMVRKF